MELIEYKKMYELEESHFWYAGKRIFIGAILLPFKSKINHILDIGCGTGGATKFLENYGQVVGIEKNDYALKLAKKRGVKAISGAASRLPFKKGSFDLVTFLDVLYHKQIKNEKKVLKEAVRVLKPKGYLLITDSAFQFLKSSHDVFLHGKRRYTISHLSRLLDLSGFKILRSSYIFASLFPALLVKRLILNKLFSLSEADTKPLPAFLNQILIILLTVEAKLLDFVSFPFGSSVIILAQKKA